MSGLVPAAFSHDPSATGAFAALPDPSADERPNRPVRAVVIGGGTGAPVSIRTLLSMGIETSAVVAMADDGGSTGILRDQAGVTAPGDIRKCITAMASDADDPLTQAFKVRFGFAGNHTLGNLMLSALEVTSGSFPKAIQVCEELLGARGHVYPSTLGRVSLVAKTRDGRTLLGQAVASHSRSALKRVVLESDEPIVGYVPACQALRDADLIVLGPGSLFTSILPNLLVPGIVEAVRDSEATVVFVCSLSDVQGETRGLSVMQHYEALEAHGMSGLVDVVLAQAHEPGRPFSEPDDEADGGIRRELAVTPDEARCLEAAGIRVLTADFADHARPTWHDPAKLRHAFAEVLKSCRSIQM